MSSCKGHDMRRTVVLSAHERICEDCWVSRRRQWILEQREKHAAAATPGVCGLCDQHSDACRMSNDLQLPVCDGCFFAQEQRMSALPKRTVAWRAPEAIDAERRIFIGAKESAQKESFEVLGIRRFLVCCTHLPVDVEGVEYLRLPIADSLEQDLSPFLEAAYEWISSGGNVQISCNAGISRSGAVATFWYMKTHGVPFDEAVAEVRKARSQVYPNSAFCEQLRRVSF